MKIVIALALTAAVFAALCIPILKKKKGIVLSAYAVGMILLFVVYNLRTLDHILPFHRPTLQSVYQKGFLETGEYADAFLEEFFKGKTVHTPDDEFTDHDRFYFTGPENTDERGDMWLFHYYHAVDMWDYLELYDATVVKDAAYNEMVLSDDQKAHFDDLGPANDMMRYTFLMTPYLGEWADGFYYYWFYNTHVGDSRVYICTEGLADASEIVLLWQHEDAPDTESYYIASKDYFDREIAR